MSDTQDPPQLYAAHEPIFPRRVKGTFRTLKWWLMGFMLGVYYITPWLRWTVDRRCPIRRCCSTSPRVGSFSL